MPYLGPAHFHDVSLQRLELSQTLDRLGWAHNTSEIVADGVRVDFSMKETYCAFSVIDEANLVPPGHPDASSVPAMPLLRRGRDGSILMPRSTPFPDMPAPWENPAQGLMLDRVTAESHALIRSKGWELIVIPLPLWRVARAAKRQHEARRDVVTSLTLPLAPFQARPVALQAEAQSKAEKDDLRSGSSGSIESAGSGSPVENNRGRIRNRVNRVAAESKAAGLAAADALKTEHRISRRKDRALAAVIASSAPATLQTQTAAKQRKSA